MFKDEVSWFLFLLLVMISLLIFLSSNYFSIEGIILNETMYFTEEELLADTPLPIGENIFKVHRATLSQDLCNNPLVKKIEIRRRLPRTLLFTITEERPLAYLLFQGALYLLGCSGLIMGQEEPPGSFSLPLIYGYPPFEEGKIPPSLEAIIPVLLNISPSFLQLVKEIQFLDDRFTFLLSQGVRLFVNMDLSKGQAQLMELIYEGQKHKNNLDYIDMRYGMNPVVKYRDGKEDF